MKTLIVGLTGQTGAGKSTVAGKLAQKGFTIIDGDVEARAIVAVGSPILKELAAAFGQDIINQDGSLNRPLLADRAFAASEKTQRLNALTHPAITAAIEKKIKDAQTGGEPAVIVDAAVLLESGIAKQCDLIAVVAAPFEVRLARIMERDKLSRRDAIKRMNAQPGEEYYAEKADIILNASPASNVEQEVEKLSALMNSRIKEKIWKTFFRKLLHKRTELHGL